KKIAFVHVDYEKAGYTRGLDMGDYHRFDKIFAVSEEITDPFLKVHPAMKDKVFVFENTIDQKAIIEGSLNGRGFSDDYDGVRILTIGRLTAQKAYEVSIAAMKILKDRKVKARWYVLGEGVLHRELLSLIKKEGLEKDFILLGAVQNPYPYLRECDVYVHASRFEGKSIALAEAKTLGCAIVASDVSGNREQIKDSNNGLLCKLDAEDIADKTEMLIKDREFAGKLGENASKEEIWGADPAVLLEM
ncbi:MAG: glycosyltransferase, partial [Lachnospiraceae bacterium]|nr:glycosyltransferase [Lachnospiraceae bacterium]